jgi:hypothetical protein
LLMTSELVPFVCANTEPKPLATMGSNIKTKVRQNTIFDGINFIPTIVLGCNFNTSTND